MGQAWFLQRHLRSEWETDKLRCTFLYVTLNWFMPNKSPVPVPASGCLLISPARCSSQHSYTKLLHKYKQIAFHLKVVKLSNLPQVCCQQHEQVNSKGRAVAAVVLALPSWEGDSSLFAFRYPELLAARLLHPCRNVNKNLSHMQLHQPHSRDVVLGRWQPILASSSCSKATLFKSTLALK